MHTEGYHTHETQNEQREQERLQIKQRYGENELDRDRDIKSTMLQAQEFAEKPADRPRELTKDATQEPQRELQSERCSYLQKEEEAFTTDGVYGLESSESVTSDNEHWNRERTSEHPATKHLGHDTTRGLKQETWSRWLGEVTSASNVGTLGATPTDIKENGEQTTPTQLGCHIQRQRGQESEHRQSREPRPGNPRSVRGVTKNALSRTHGEGSSAERKSTGRPWTLNGDQLDKHPTTSKTGK